MIFMIFIYLHDLHVFLWENPWFSWENPWFPVKIFPRKPLHGTARAAQGASFHLRALASGLQCMEGPTWAGDGWGIWMVIDDSIWLSWYDNHIL